MNRNNGEYKGFVLSESLSDPLILNNFAQIYIKIEKHQDPLYPAFWHLFKISASEDTIDNNVDLVCKHLKNGWYAHFWNDETLYICLSNNSFKLNRHLNNYDLELDKVKEFAEELGINKCYLDFIMED